MHVTALYRHPVKGHGCQALQAMTLYAGQSMPFDRHWAVAHEESNANGNGWVACQNFSRGSKAPALMAINAVLDETTGQLTLTHPARPDLTLDPDYEGDRLIEWVRPLVPANRALPDRVLRLAGRGFTDSAFPSISLCNAASHEAVSQKTNKPLSPLRWRSNIWFEGAEPWVEFGWTGQEITLGTARLKIVEPIVRCLATTANPKTGRRDVDTLAILNNNWNHQNFGVYAKVIQSGDVVVGAPLMVQ